MTKREMVYELEFADAVLSMNLKQFNEWRKEKNDRLGIQSDEMDISSMNAYKVEYVSQMIRNILELKDQKI